VDDRFADWCRIVDPNPRADTLATRWNVIEALSERAYVALVLDLVRLYTGARQRDVPSAAPFVAEFKKADPTLPIKGNDELVRILAGATLAAVITDRDAVADSTALALVSARFAGHGGTPVNPDLEEDTDRYLIVRSRQARSPDSQVRKGTPVASRIKKIVIPDLAKLGQMASVHHYEEYNTAATSIQAYAGDMTKVLGKLRDLIAEAVADDAVLPSANGLEQLPEWKSTKEELNILWWLYGESSRDLELPTANLSVDTFTLPAGKELADLTTLLPGILSADAMLRRALRGTGGALDAPVGLHALVDAPGSDWCRATVEATDAPPTSLGTLAPLHLALRRSVSDGHGWLPAFLGALGLADEPHLLPVAAAHQIYTERLLGRALLPAAAAPRSKWTLGEELTSD
jgi:hypothetical protein